MAERSRPSPVLRVLAVGCGVLAFGGLCIVGLSARLLLAQLDPAGDAAVAFLEDVRAADYASALRRMAPAYQREHDADHLRHEVEAIEPLTGHLRALVTSTETHDERVTVDAMLIGASGAVPISFEVIREGGYEYLDLVVVEGRLVD